jgi:hypothetical protein
MKDQNGTEQTILPGEDNSTGNGGSIQKPSKSKILVYAIISLIVLALTYFIIK